jgi:hypothetical protein
MKKRRQHHVWQHYLKSWTVGDQLYCLRNGEIFETGTSSVAVDRDFYKLHTLTADDLALIKMLVIDPARPLAKQHHENLLIRLAGPGMFIEQIRDRVPNIEQMDELLDVHQTNALEDYHTGIENSFLPLLDDILKSDLSFYESDDHCITFFHFICTQHMRTKGVKERSIERVRLRDGQDLSRIWAIMTHMFAFNIGLSLYHERKLRKLVLVNNRTEVPFITGDQPIVNLHGDGVRPPDELSFYYPLSPNLALILTEVDREPPFSTDGLTSAQATNLNTKIVEACHSQLFGQTKASLLPLKEFAAAQV